MKVNDLIESPFLLPSSASNSKMALKHDLVMKEHFEKLIGQTGEWEKKLNGLTLMRFKNNYILFDNNNVLFYGLQFVEFEDGISVVWMKNYSAIKGLTSLIFTEIIKYDDFCDIIYSGDTHTESNFNLHKNIKYFRQLKVDVWDEKKKTITNENPYSGIFSTKKQFRFRLDESISKNDVEDFNFRSIYLKENFDLTTENIEHNLQMYVFSYFFDGVLFEKSQ